MKHKEVKLSRKDILFLKKSERNIMKKILQNRKPMKKMDMINAGIPHATVMRGVDPLASKGSLQAVSEEEWKNKYPTREYDLTIQGFLALSLACPDYILDKIEDSHNLFLKHGFDDIDVNALAGMVKAWVFYAPRSARINGKLPYYKNKEPRREFFLNISRAIRSLTLWNIGLYPEFGAVSETPWLMPSTLTILQKALTVEAKLPPEEVEALLRLLYEKHIHLNNSQDTLRDEMEWEKRFGESQKEFWVAGYFYNDGSSFRVGAKLNPEVLKGNLPLENQSIPVLESIQEVVVKKLRG